MELGIPPSCLILLCLLSIETVEAGFFTFYFPNALKPRGFNEISDMIDRIDGHINETKDQYADARYFWGLMQNIDEQMKDAYPEESVCTDVFPLFRDLAIDYAAIDYTYYIKPYEEYKEHLIEFRSKWYPAGLESKAALPREWEQELLRFELKNKIEWFGNLTNKQEFRDKRQKMVDIWKKVRRGLDQSLPCVYLRYAYRQIAEDISQVALDANLDSMRESLKLLESSDKRVEKYKEKDRKIISDIMAEVEKEERFHIKT